MQVLEGQVQVSSTGLYSIFRMRGWHDRGPGASFGRPGATFNIKGSVAPEGQWGGMVGIQVQVLYFQGQVSSTVVM